MKISDFGLRQSLVAVSVLALTLSLAHVVRVEAVEPTVRLPNFVIKSDGNVMGPVIGVDGDVTFTLIDPTFDSAIPMKLRKTSGTVYLEGSENRVWYSDMDCEGTVYIQEPESSLRTFSTAIDRTYATGIDPAPANSNVKLYRGTGTDGSTPSVNSNWTNGACQNSTSLFGATVVEATEILDITATWPPPYTVE